MKVGAEQKSKLYLLLGLLVAGLALYFWSQGGDGGLNPSGFTGGGGAGKLPDLSHLDPTLHLAQLDALRAVKYEGGSRDLFHFGRVAPPPPPPGAARAGAGRGEVAVQAGPQPPVHLAPPPPPPLPLKFYGSAGPSAGGTVRIFLQLGDKDYIVAQGDLVEKRYLVEAITKVSVKVKDTQTQQEQELPLFQGNQPGGL